jgi:HK97 family phage prohead protease
VNKIFHIGSTFKAFEEGDDLHIAGMASTNNTDRVGDVIETEAWTKGGLQNYLNNPVILFNHDYNQPIGRAITLGTNDNGLQLKAKIAKSAGHVGELIKEGVLGAFSVGFRVKDAEYMTETDGYKIKDAELLEVSVVTVPANQAATFSLAKSFNSESEYEEFKKSFKTEDSVEEKHILNIQETEDKVTVEFEKHSKTESMPKDLSQVEVQEKTMSDIDIDAIVAAAVEKTATAMAMKDAERKAEEQTRLEAEQKAAENAQVQKAAEEARIVTAVSSGTEKLMADVEAKMSEKDANHMEVVKQFEKELSEKSDEIQKMRDSKRVFADRGEKSSFTEDDMVNAHILGVVTNKGLEGTKFGRSILEKATNNTAGVRLPASASDDFESTVSTAIERDIELELVLDPLFRKIQMSAASMIIPTMPDSGYAEWLSANAAGTGSAAAPKGNLGSRDEASPGANAGVTLGSKVLTVEKLVSKSFMANETEEDAIMPVLPLIREAMVRAHARAIEHSILQAGSSEVVNAGGQNGLIKLATDDSKVLDAGASAGAGAVVATTAQLLNMRQAMGKYGRRPSDVVYIVSLDAYYDMLDDPEFQDVNLVGSDRATKISGEIGQAYGSPIIVCDEFTGGKTANKVWGVAVNVRNFLVPVLRGVTVESDYEVANQQRVLVATQRRGFDQMFAAAGQVVAHKW